MAEPAATVTHLLDTDHISVLFDGRGPAFDILAGRLAAADGSPVRFAFSVVSFEEQVGGALALLKGRGPGPRVMLGYSLLDRYLALYRRAVVLPFDAAAAAEFNRLNGEPGVRRVGTQDLRIASVALANGLTLLTRNAKDFARVPGLAFEDWTAPAAD